MRGTPLLYQLITGQFKLAIQRENWFASRNPANGRHIFKMQRKQAI
jgi:hypothetical protein